MLKSLLVAAALFALPAAAAAQEAPPTGAPLPKCTAKVQDSCDQSATTEKNAIDYYPADSRDAGNNKIGKASAAAPAVKKRTPKKVMPMAATTPDGDPPAEVPAK